MLCDDVGLDENRSQALQKSKEALVAAQQEAVVLRSQVQDQIPFERGKHRVRALVRRQQLQRAKFVAGAVRERDVGSTTQTASVRKSRSWNPKQLVVIKFITPSRDLGRLGETSKYLAKGSNAVLDSGDDRIHLLGRLHSPLHGPCAVDLTGTYRLCLERAIGPR